MHKIFKLLFILLFIVSSRTYANVDSLLTVAKESKVETQRLDALLTLVRHYNRKDRVKHDSLFEEADKIYQSLSDTTEFSGRYYSRLGNKNFKDGNHEIGIQNYELAISIYLSENDYASLWGAYNSLGSIYEEVGNYSEALSNYLKSMEVAENHLTEGSVAGTSINLGIIYAQQGELEEALKYFRISKDYHAKKGVNWGLGNNLNNIGQVYSLMEESDSSLFYFKAALDVWEEIEDQQGITMTCHNIGNLYVNTEDYDLAEQYLRKSLDMCYEMNETFGITLNVSVLSELFLKLGQKEKGLSFLYEALEHAKNNHLLVQEKSLHYQLYEFYKGEENYKDALFNHEEYFILYDSLYNVEKLKNLKEIQTKYETEKKQLELEIQRSELAEKDLTIAESNNKILLLSSLSVIFIGIILFVIYTLSQKNKANRIIEHQKELVEEKNKEILDSINYAKRIQAAILPPQRIVKEYLADSFILYKPKDIVAGDFYWMEQKDGKTLFAAADCTGHGVPGAMVSVICNNGLNRSVREYGLTDPGMILDKTREIVIQEFEKSDEDVYDGMDIALCSIEGNKLQYAGAHNPLWIIRNSDNKEDIEIIEIKANKQPIGQFFSPTPYTTHTFKLQKGDTIYIFSDGYIDQFGGERGKKFKAKAFKALLRSIQNLSMENQKKRIDFVFEDWRGDIEQIDDVCVIGVRV